MNTGRRRCVARSERAKYKEGGELLARRSFSSIHLRTDRIHPSSLQANGGGGWIRRGRKRGGYFQPIFDRNKPERGMISIRIPFAFYLFSPISVNFDKYIDPKVSTCLRNVTRFKALLSAFTSFEYSKERLGGTLPFYEEREYKYRSDLDQRTRCISRGSYREHIKAKRATINNLPRPLYTLSAAIKRIDPPGSGLALGEGGGAMVVDQSLFPPRSRQRKGRNPRGWRTINKNRYFGSKWKNRKNFCQTSSVRRFASTKSNERGIKGEE